MFQLIILSNKLRVNNRTNWALTSKPHPPTSIGEYNYISEDMVNQGKVPPTRLNNIWILL